METKLYPGIPFSPQATLTDNIGAADTIIKVSDVSAFPPAPNLATIGTDEYGETILYTAKTATALSGCQRGVEGTARTWQAGELIGRNFTAKDHADLIATTSEAREAAAAAETSAGAARDAAQKAEAEAADKASAAVETAEQAARDAAQAKENARTADTAAASASSAAADAKAAAESAQKDVEDIRQRLSGVNLLDVWYFVDPANQRGETEYYNGKYGVDRWMCSAIRITQSGIYFMMNGSSMIQPIDNYIKDNINGKQITFSALVSDGTLASGTIVYQKEPEHNLIVDTANGLQLAIQEETGSAIVYCAIPQTVVAVKLELGSVQTLAHKEEDTWVLNDPPPNRALELLKCQRYYQVFSSDDLRPTKAVDFRPPMRIDPALNTISIDGTTYYNGRC